MKTEFVKTLEFTKRHKFNFRCEGCGSQGEIEIPFELKRFVCPEGCGAVYVLWHNPEPQIMCVVKPVFVDDDDLSDECAYCDEWERCTCYDD